MCNYKSSDNIIILYERRNFCYKSQGNNNVGIIPTLPTETGSRSPASCLCQQCYCTREMQLSVTINVIHSDFQENTVSLYIYIHVYID